MTMLKDWNHVLTIALDLHGGEYVIDEEEDTEEEDWDEEEDFEEEEW